MVFLSSFMIRQLYDNMYAGMCLILFLTYRYGKGGGVVVFRQDYEQM